MFASDSVFRQVNMFASGWFLMLIYTWALICTYRRNVAKYVKPYLLCFLVSATEIYSNFSF